MKHEAELFCLAARVKEALRRKFATIANDFERRVRDITAEISALDGPLEVRNVSHLCEATS